MVFGWRQEDVRGVDGDAGIPMIGHARNRRGHDMARKAERFAHTDPPQLWDPNPAVFDTELVVAEGKAVISPLPLEFRILGAASKEIFERAAELPNGDLRRVLSHFQHPRKFFTLDGVELTSKRGRARLGER